MADLPRIPPSDTRVILIQIIISINIAIAMKLTNGKIIIHNTQHNDDDDKNPEDTPTGKTSVGILGVCHHHHHHHHCSSPEGSDAGEDEPLLRNQQQPLPSYQSLFFDDQVITIITIITHMIVIINHHHIVLIISNPATSLQRGAPTSAELPFPNCPGFIIILLYIFKITFDRHYFQDFKEENLTQTISKREAPPPKYEEVYEYTNGIWCEEV